MIDECKKYESIEAIADDADVIFRGYAFTLEDGYVRVLNLNRPRSAALMRPDGEILETSMDEIEAQLMLSYWNRMSKYVMV
jgi:hypothetical protein